jgi:hypothetical protein
MRIFLVKVSIYLAVIFVPLLGFAQCKLGALPTIQFFGKGVTLSKDAKAMLSSIAANMRSNPLCHVQVTGYAEMTKAGQQRSWDRVNAVINYLQICLGISADRFIFQYGEEGDPLIVDLKAAEPGMEGPAAVPAPHPNTGQIHDKDDCQESKSENTPSKTKVLKGKKKK